MNDLFPKKYNFICVILGDNDFTNAMHYGMRQLKEWTDLEYVVCPVEVKHFMIECMIHHHKLGDILRGKPMTTEEEVSLRDYFSKIRVLFNEKFPTCDIEGNIPADYDGGAIYVDVNTGFIQSF